MPSKTIPENLHIAVGYTCNNACVFCMESDIRSRHSVKKFNDTRIFSTIKECAGAYKVNFAQGEPTLNPRLLEYIAFAKKLGSKEISVISNGRQYADNEFCMNMINAGVTEFIVSIHGHKKEIHDSLTTAKGSFEQTAKGLKNISKLKEKFNIKLMISHVVNKKNYKYIGKFLEFIEMFNCDGVVLNVVQPRGGRMKKDFEMLMPNYSDVGKYITKIIGNKNNRFGNGKRRYISVIDLPPCMMPKLEEYLGFGGERIFQQKNKFVSKTNSRLKEKRRLCRECKYFSVCEGVYFEYIKRKGWDEFVPI